ASGRTLEQVWDRIYGATAFFAGTADDPVVPDYLVVLDSTHINVLVPNQLATPSFYRGVLPALEELSEQRIYGGTGAIVIQGDAGPEQLELALLKSAGMRFLGQRYQPDSELLGRLVYPGVGPGPSGDVRTMPDALDVAAMLGSGKALSLLEEKGATGFAGYGEILEGLRESFEAGESAGLRSNLYMCWLDLLSGQLEAHGGETGSGPGYPVFMRSPDWGLKTLSTALASWAGLRHDTILYVKQSYTLPIGGPAPPLRPLPGYVEPVPELYAGVRAVLGMMERGLESLGMLDEHMSASIREASTLVEVLQGISEKELAGDDLTESERLFLLSFADQLQSVLPNTSGRALEGSTILVADVHTDAASGQVLEVGSGYPDMAVVVYQTAEGRLGLAAGPVMSFYQITMPSSRRLTDERWQGLLDAGQIERPWWYRCLQTQDELVDR
ncbi:DUF3160 domain-containing protein, partial [Candidatus Fermentibacterales bacterium]|nr:DUF3160 domain-containing protein [Candidatus Fermentibacterales bacterium]